MLREKIEDLKAKRKVKTEQVNEMFNELNASLSSPIFLQLSILIAKVMKVIQESLKRG